MTYNISSISNRDIQLLYEYRILREASDNLSAICKSDSPILIDTLIWTKSDRQIEGYDSVYEATLLSDFDSNAGIPFLEFHPNDNTDWKWIADFIEIEAGSSLILYSTTDKLEKLPISIYQCWSLRHIESLLSDILDDIKKLAEEFDSLEKSLSEIKSSVTKSKPEGLVPNLVKLHQTDLGLELVDSDYRILTAEKNRLYVNYSQDNLNQMEHIMNDSVEFRFMTSGHYVLDDFVAPIFQVSGIGDLVLKNIKGQVLVTHWVGTVTVIDCPEVHLSAASASDICRLTNLQISGRSTVYLENQVHQINRLNLLAGSLCRHWRANVHNLEYVGPGCTYWCSAQVSVPGRVQLAEYTEDSNTVFDFNVHDIIGAFTSDFNNIMIVGQKNLTTRLGNCDAEPPPSIYVVQYHMDYHQNN